jgi:hypothetical protein
MMQLTDREMKDINYLAKRIEATAAQLYADKTTRDVEATLIDLENLGQELQSLAKESAESCFTEEGGLKP